jgi:hypothetical protein
MRRFLHSVLAFLTLGMWTMGCTRSDTPSPPPAQTDVVLTVPGMH